MLNQRLYSSVFKDMEACKLVKDQGMVWHVEFLGQANTIFQVFINFISVIKTSLKEVKWPLVPFKIRPNRFLLYTFKQILFNFLLLWKPRNFFLKNCKESVSGTSKVPYISPFSVDLCDANGVVPPKDAIADVVNTYTKPFGVTNQNEAFSFHTGGINACFADGSVKFVKDSIKNVWPLSYSQSEILSICKFVIT